MSYTADQRSINFKHAVVQAQPNFVFIYNGKLTYVVFKNSEIAGIIRSPIAIMKTSGVRLLLPETGDYQHYGKHIKHFLLANL